VAYAAARNFETTVKWQTKANLLCTGNQSKANGEIRLKLYQEKKPYQETGP